MNIDYNKYIEIWIWIGLSYSYGTVEGSDQHYNLIDVLVDVNNLKLLEIAKGGNPVLGYDVT